MSITVKEDVGGDLAAVQSVIDGESTSYTTAKRYETKAGERVQVALTVWKFPTVGSKLVGFSVEAPAMSNATMLEDTLDEFHDKHMSEIAALKQRLEQLEAIYKSFNTVGAFALKWLPLITATIGLIAFLVKLSMR